VIFFLPQKLEKFRISSVNLTSFFFNILKIKISKKIYHKNWKRKKKNPMLHFKPKVLLKKKESPKIA